ncbi:MAG: hypothetical protein K2X90_03025 [Candidatus Babeliaceae bacterium]|nr:hypothetical protein [Candidatus Babeliaceae bacterium]
MSYIESIQNFFSIKSTRELYIYFGVFLGVLILPSVIIVYSHFKVISKLTLELKKINKQRAVAQEILIKNKEVIAQQEAVKAILAEEPNFYIGQYFTDLLRSQNLQNNLTKDPERSESDVGNGFIEHKLAVTFSKLNMKLLTELLFKIEQNQRVYTKELKIIKNIKDGLLDVTLIIATLEPQQTSA